MSYEGTINYRNRGYLKLNTQAKKDFQQQFTLYSHHKLISFIYTLANPSQIQVECLLF